MLGKPDQVDPAPGLCVDSVDGLGKPLSQADEQFTPEDLGPQEPVPDDQRVSDKGASGDVLVEDGPLAQVPVDQDPGRRAALEGRVGLRDHRAQFPQGANA